MPSSWMFYRTHNFPVHSGRAREERGPQEEFCWWLWCCCWREIIDKSGKKCGYGRDREYHLQVRHPLRARAVQSSPGGRSPSSVPISLCEKGRCSFLVNEVRLPLKPGSSKARHNRGIDDQIALWPSSREFRLSFVLLMFEYFLAACFKCWRVCLLVPSINHRGVSGADTVTRLAGKCIRLSPWPVFLLRLFVAMVRSRDSTNEVLGARAGITLAFRTLCRRSSGARRRASERTAMIRTTSLGRFFCWAGRCAGRGKITRSLHLMGIASPPLRGSHKR